MSIRWMSRVWSESPYDGTRLLIHLALADIAHDDGRFFASQKNLSGKSRCSIEYVRKVINEMIDAGWLQIVTKGSSRGKATVYQLIWDPKKLPNTVVESEPLESDELPNSHGDNSPTLIPQPPNSTPYHSSYTTILSTTKSETAVAVIAPGELAAKTWWEKLEVKPIGKGAWFSLVEICKAAEKQGYTTEQIIGALNYIGTVPSLRQMDLVLRGVGVKTRTETSVGRAMDISRRFEEMENQ